jgi:hypothetical protein
VFKKALDGARSTRQNDVLLKREDDSEIHFDFFFHPHTHGEKSSSKIFQVYYGVEDIDGKA